jgi:SAM-dependent methyltransferase
MRLPDLAGKSVLDLGCNEGFFCWYAWAAGASRVVGVDKEDKWIERARLRCPAVEFIVSDWREWASDEQFDVVILASALHYADDQEWLLHFAMSRVAAGGLLVLEIGVANGDEDQFWSAKRSIDTRSFPTRRKIEGILARYAYKYVGLSVKQEGDPVARWVLHCRCRQPMVVLLLGAGYSGKSTLARLLSAKGIDLVRFDDFFTGFLSRPGFLDENLREIFTKFNPLLQGDKIIVEIFESPSTVQSFVRCLLPSSPPEILVIDGYVPAKFQRGFIEEVKKYGYVVWSADCQSAEIWEDRDGLLNEFIVVSDNFVVKTDRIVGHIDAVLISDKGLTISGWGIDPLDRSPLSGVMLKSGDYLENVLVLRQVMRKDLVERGYVSEGAAAGFDLFVNSDSVFFRLYETEGADVFAKTVEFIGLHANNVAGKLSLTQLPSVGG